MAEFSYNEKSFLLDGKPVQILSGTIHYFRHVPEYWRDRLKKLRQCGFNTVETYTCWNRHEPHENEFDFSGILDLGKFIDTAKEEGLYCIVRPGPYICAEWDFGGLPAWLLCYRNMRIRCLDKTFLEKEERYLTKLFEIIRPRLITNGGNVILMQVENEYGSYGNDHAYIAHLADFYRKSGINVPLFTSDGPGDNYLGGGTDPSLLVTGNFGSNAKGFFEKLREYRPDQPVMCSEFWEGWFDTWYAPHHRREPDDIAELLDYMLSVGGNANFYMFCGGTNFGFNNGANMTDVYMPQTTSYDYDAALTESGDLTKRFYEVRKVAEKYFKDLPEITVKNSEKAAYGEIRPSSVAPLFRNLDKLSAPVESPFPLSMEELGCYYGYTLYTTYADRVISDELIIDPVRDRAIVFIDGEFAGIKERDRRDDKIMINVGEGEKKRIDILIENMGHINYGVQMSDNEKGVVGSVRIAQQKLFHWTMRPLPMDNVKELVEEPYNVKVSSFPCFFKANLEIKDTPCDTFLRLDNCHKGFVLVNGFNIGRYFNDAGPQKTLYVPAPLLKKGDNEIIVFESDSAENPIFTFTDVPELG